MLDGKRIAACLTLCASVALATQPVKASPGSRPQPELRQVLDRYLHSGIQLPRGRVSDAELGDPFLIDTTILASPGPGFRHAVASDGNGWLAVWEDTILLGSLLGARIGADGALIDSLPMEIAYYGRVPAVTFDGTNYVVAWEDGRTGGYTCIYAGRVTPAGELLDPDGIAISALDEYQTSPSISSDGTNSLVVWHDTRAADPEVYGARLTTGGVLLDSSGVNISRAAGDQARPVAAWGGGCFLVAWEDYRTNPSAVYAARVLPEGVALDSGGFAISTAADQHYNPSVAFDSSRFLVTWCDLSSGTPAVYARRIAPDRTLVDSAAIVVSNTPGENMDPDVAGDSAGFLVAWSDYRLGDFQRVWCARVSQEGVLLDSAGVQVAYAAGYQISPMVALGAGNCLLMWEDGRNINYGGSPYAARVSPVGSALDSAGILLAPTVNQQVFSTAAYDGTNYLLAWQDYGGSQPADLMGIRVTPEGVPVDPAPFVISDAVGYQGGASIAFDGTNYLAVWQDYRIDGIELDIFAARVTPGGTVLDPDGFVICDEVGDQQLPTVAFSGDNYLVTWTDTRNGGYFPSIYAARVTPAGAVLDPDGFPLTEDPSPMAYSAVAAGDTGWLVVWSDGRNGNDFDIRGTRVTPDGVVVDTFGIPVAVPADYQIFPGIAFDGANYLVAWEDWTGGAANIRTARIARNGTVLDTLSTLLGPAYQGQMFVPVIFDGDKYVVAWFRILGNRGQIWTALVRTDNSLMDTTIEITSNNVVIYPKLAGAGLDEKLLTYTGYAGNVNGKLFDQYRIWGKLDLMGGTAERTIVPAGRRLLEVIPGIFSQQAEIRVPGASFAIRHSSLEVLDASGRRVRRLAVPAPSSAGESRLVWDGTDDAGRRLSNGVYLVRLFAGPGSDVRSVTILR